VVTTIALAVTSACGGSARSANDGAHEPGGRIPVSGQACEVLKTAVASEYADATPAFPPLTIWTGNEYSVFWVDLRSTELPPVEGLSRRPGTYVAALDADGVARPERFVSEEQFRSVVPTAGGFAAVLATYHPTPNASVPGLHFWRLDEIGTPVGEPVLLKEPAQWSSTYGPVLVATNQGFGVAWGSDAPGFALLDSEGRTLSETSFEPESLRVLPGLVWTGDGFVLSWSRGGRAFFRELDAGGRPRGSAVYVGGGDGWSASQPHLTWHGDGYTILWTESSEDESRLRVSRIDRSGSVVGASSHWFASFARYVSIGAETAALVYEDQNQGVLARFDASGAITRAQRVAGDFDWNGLSELTYGREQYAVGLAPTTSDDGRVYLLQIDCP
jgi:hypothetical protein